MLAALFATSVAALATSAGLVGTGDPGKRVADVPELSRALIQRAIVEAPAWQHQPSLAYARRADELLRLRALPAPPPRAIVDDDERARAEAVTSAPPAETSGASTHPATDSIAVASAPAADAPAVTGRIDAGTPAPDAPAAATLKPVTLASRLSDAPPSDPQPPDANVPQHADDATEVAAVESGPDATESAKPPERKLTARGRIGLRVRIRRPVRILAPRTIPPQATTGFPIAAPQPTVPAHSVAAAARPAPPTLNTAPVADTRIDSGR